MKKVFSIILACVVLLNATCVFSDSTDLNKTNSANGAAAVVNAVDITSCADNTYVLDSNGKVWGWGDNGYRQLGQALTAEQKSTFTPTELLNMSGIKAISAGRGYILALTNDGFISGMGNNANGQVDPYSYKVNNANGQTNSSSDKENNANNQAALPSNTEMIAGAAHIQGLSNITAISAGNGYAMALKSDGTVYIWGEYRYRIGNSPKPIAVKAVTDVERIFALDHHAFVVNKSGDVFELKGVATTANELDSIDNVVSIVESSNRIYAADTDGNLWTWSMYGNDIRQVEGANNIVQLIKNKDKGVLALDRDGVIWQCDDATLKLNQLSGIDRASKISSGTSHFAVLRTDGSVWTWGDNSKGQLGNGGALFYKTPVKLESISNVKAAAATKEYSVILKNDGTVWTFGSNKNGVLGDGNRTDKYAPTQVQGLTDVEKISASATHVLALKEDGTVWAWGSNDSGQLGDGTYTDRLTPVQVKNIKNVADIAALNQFSIVLLKNGNVWTWGNSGYGVESDKVKIDRTLPIQVNELYGIKMISAGYDHILALKSDRTVWALGSNGSGQYGYEVPQKELDKMKPLRVSGVSDVKYIAAGYYHNIAIKWNGTVIGWGDNSFGQLGVKNTGNIYSKYTIRNFENVASVIAGSNHSFAIKNDGTVWAWGNNSSGQLGIGNDVAYFNPVEVPNLGDVRCIAAGNNYSMAVQNDGTLWVWGDNRFGQLGLGRKDEIVTDIPTQISIH